MPVLDRELLVWAAATVLVLWLLIATGLGRLMLLFGLTVALSLAAEGLIYLALLLLLPGLVEVGLGEEMVAWALLPALVTAVAVSYYAWREGV